MNLLLLSSPESELDSKYKFVQALNIILIVLTSSSARGAILQLNERQL